MNKDEALRLALEALEGFYEYGYDRRECYEHITAIKAALEANESNMGKVDKLRVALMKANNQAEHFEREWYLRGDEIERLKAALEAKDEPSMKVEGPMHVVCQCDKCKVQPEQKTVDKLQEPTVERAWFTIDELNAWADKKLSENPHWVMPKDEPEREDEPVAWISPSELLVMRGNALGGAKDWRVNVGLKPEDGDVGLYTTPPQRTWVGLTDAEIEIIYAECNVWDKFEYERMLETKLKEKNT